MKITLLAFGITKDILGARKLDYEIQDSATVGSLLEDLGQRYPRLSDLATRG